MGEIRPLSASDSRAGFASGHPDLDRFFRQYAGQNQFTHHIGATYVAVKKGAIVGYATVAAAHIEIENVPAALAKRLPRYPLPVLRLARLAVDVSARRKDTGSALLRHVFSLARTMADLAGCVGVVVDAKPDGVAFYEKLGFIALPAAEGSPPRVPRRRRCSCVWRPLRRRRRVRAEPRGDERSRDAAAGDVEDRVQIARRPGAVVIGRRRAGHDEQPALGAHRVAPPRRQSH